MNSNLPSDISTLLNNALAAHRQGQVQQAVAYYEQVLRIEPDHVVATQLLGTISLQIHQYAKARQLLQKAIELDAYSGVAHHNLARLCEVEGDLEGAETHYSRAFELMPDNADTSFSLANVLTALGRLDESERRYRQTLSINSSYADAHRQLARLLHHTSIDSDILAMESLMEQPATNDSAKIQLGFGLGKAYEDLADYQAAFKNYSLANDLKRSQLRFDINSWDVEVDKVKGVFSERLFEQFAHAGQQGARPVFILGMPRSGTSLVEQILASHSRVFGGGELQTLNMSVMSSMDVSGYPGNVSALPVAAFDNMARHYLAKTALLSGDAPLVTDKKPDNFKLIGMIKLMFPDAIVIHTCRSPLDNCLSLFKNHFSDNGPFYSYNQAELGQYYLGYERLMKHWHSVLPGFVYDIHYESLVANQESETRALLSKCGLEFEPACLDFHKTARDVKTASAVQVRKSLYSSSVELWRRFETPLQPLVKALEER